MADNPRLKGGSDPICPVAARMTPVERTIRPIRRLDEPWPGRGLRGAEEGLSRSGASKRKLDGILANLCWSILKYIDGRLDGWTKDKKASKCRTKKAIDDCHNYSQLPE